MANAVPPSLTALGRESLPPRIVVGDQSYDHCRTFKNDFFAVTALYEGSGGRVLLKINRKAPFLLVPLAWLGRRLALRECAALVRLDDVAGVPRLIDRFGRAGVIREFIEGHPLARGERVPDDFHPRLQALVDTLHQRGMAYVDLEKCENVLVGDDGRPYLFDFQISWGARARGVHRVWPFSLLGRWLQAGDGYHLTKLQRRTRPDQLTPEALAASYRKPWYLHLYGALTAPFTWCRRRVLHRIAPRTGRGERGRLTTD